MTFRYTTLAVAALLALGNAHAADGLGIKFSGFGTLAAVHSSERKADFTGNFAQPNGAGYTQGTSLAPDSKLGAQLDARYDKLSAVLQVVSQHQYDNSYRPQFEWANIKYQITPEFSARLGRIALPNFMMAETRLVGYTNTTARPPLELYGVSPMTSNDGIDATYRNTIGSVNNRLQAFYGRTKIKLPGGGSLNFKIGTGINDTVDIGSLTVRLAAARGVGKFDLAGFNALLGGLNQLAAAAAGVPVPAFQSVAAQASALSRKYNTDEVGTNLFTIGAIYDPGDWFVSGEAFKLVSKGFVANSTGWSVASGYRFGSLTPYAQYAKVKPNLVMEDPITTTGADPLAPAAAALSGGLNLAITSLNAKQSSVAIGVRWDFMRNVAFKAQYDRISLGANSSGRLANLQPGFVPGSKLNVATVSIDFVY